MAEVIPNSEEHPPATRPGPSLVETAVTLFGASTFAIAQPLFDLLSGHVEFLIAHRMGPLDLIALAALLCIVPAAIALLLTAVLGLVAPNAARFATCAIVGVAVTATALPPLDRTFALSGAFSVPLALALGIAAAFAFARLGPMRTFTRYLGIGAVGLPLWFLFGGPTSALVAGTTAADDRITEVRGSTPVVRNMPR